MNHCVARLILGSALALAAATAPAADRPVTDGPVVYFSYINVLPGQYDAYMKYLATTWKPIMDAQKKAGLILDFSVYRNVAHKADQPELILATTYRNMAALDDLDAKLDPLITKTWGTLEKSEAAKADRAKMRVDLGGDLLRKVEFR